MIMDAIIAHPGKGSKTLAEDRLTLRWRGSVLYLR